MTTSWTDNETGGTVWSENSPSNTAVSPYIETLLDDASAAAARATLGAAADADLTAHLLDTDAAHAASAVSFTPSGIGAVTRDLQTVERTVVRTSDFSSTANFNTALLALTEGIGVKQIVLGTVNSPLAQYRLKGYDGGPVNDWGGFGYNLSDTLYIPNVLTEPQLWLGLESNFPNNAARDPLYGTEPTSEVYFRWMPIGVSSSSGYLESFFSNFARTSNKIIRTDVRAERITLGNTPDGSYHDYLSITPTAWTFTLTDLTATSAKGALGAGSGSVPINWITTFSGHSGGTTSLTGNLIFQTVSGANAVVLSQAEQISAVSAATNTVTTLSAATGVVKVSGSGNATNAKTWRSSFVLDSSGGVTTGDNFIAEVPTLSSTGAIATFRGFACKNIGHATLVTTAIGFDVEDMTKSASASVGYRGQLNAASGKYNLYMSGTADNYLEGKVQFGATGIAANAAQTVTVGNVGPGAGAVSIQEWASVKNAAGTTRYIPLFG